MPATTPGAFNIYDAKSTFVGRAADRDQAARVLAKHPKGHIRNAVTGYKLDLSTPAWSEMR